MEARRAREAARERWANDRLTGTFRGHRCRRWSCEDVKVWRVGDGSKHRMRRRVRYKECMRLMRRAAEEHLTNGVLARLAVSPQATAQPISGVTGSDWLPTNDEITAFYHLVIARRASPGFQSHDVVLESHDHDASSLASHINTCNSPSESPHHFLLPTYHFSIISFFTRYITSACQTTVASLSQIRQVLPSRYFQLDHSDRLTHTLPTLQPDSQKSTSEHIGDKMKGTADDVASALQPKVYRFSFVVITCPNLPFRIRSPRASNSVTRSRATRRAT